MTTRSLWDRIPEEMKWTPQWVIAGADKSPYSVHNGELYRASSTSPRQWLDFETACDYAALHGLGIGFMLADSDPYTCIDLDVCDEASQIEKGEVVDSTLWTTRAQFERYLAIVHHFDSYTERSRSGKGLHIWVRGDIGKGRKREGVEVYSRERFIICTGDVVSDRPIAARKELLGLLLSEMGPPEDADDELVELAPVEPDEVIWQRARDAVNNAKFIPLCEGRWQELGFKSQSEADLALMSMFCFYSESNEQCRRMFRQTGLGQREKAVKNDSYLNYTLTRIRSRQAREQIKLNHGAALASALLATMRAPATLPPPTTVSQLVQAMQAPQHHAGGGGTQAATLAQLAPLPKVDDDGLPWPPGFAGAIAGFIYKRAMRPVKEVAIVGALGLLAGICGRAWNIPQSGLNLYIILVARSAVGKEAMHSGIGALMEAMRSRVPNAMEFVDFSDFASGPALTKAVAVNTCFVNVTSEWGKKMRRFAAEGRPDGPMEGLRTVMTALYQKSGSGSIVGGISYSNQEQNAGSVDGVAYSMIGETTPNTLYESLTETMMEDGFLSRFIIIDYRGDRPPQNPDLQEKPDSALADALAQLCAHSYTMNSKGHRIQVEQDSEAESTLTAFRLECDDRINETTDEAYRQMYNRAHLKALRISALLAVADNYIHPVVTKVQADWAISVVRRDIAIMQRRITDGDVGISDTSRERKIIALCKDFLTNGVPPSYKVDIKMVEQGIVPRKYFQMRLSRHSAFTHHKMGAIMAMDSTLRSLVDSGFLMEMDRTKLVSDFGYHGKCYRILNVDSI